MNKKTWTKFVEARDEFRDEVESLRASLPALKALQQKLVDARSPSYQVETSVVYNGALDEVNPDSEIKMILVADNPGRREQAAENRRYLVGPSGKIADKFFRENPSLGIDFYRNVIILNKTPVHTPRTVELRALCALDKSGALGAALEGSQIRMARLLQKFMKALCDIPAWIIGYSEMKKGGIFDAYTRELVTMQKEGALGETLFLYRHFSMNQFTIDLKQRRIPDEPVQEALRRIGADYRRKYLY